MAATFEQRARACTDNNQALQSARAPLARSLARLLAAGGGDDSSGGGGGAAAAAAYGRSLNSPITNRGMRRVARRVLRKRRALIADAASIRRPAAVAEVSANERAPLATAVVVATVVVVVATIVAAIAAAAVARLCR